MAAWLISSAAILMLSQAFPFRAYGCKVCLESLGYVSFGGTKVQADSSNDKAINRERILKA